MLFSKIASVGQLSTHLLHSPQRFSTSLSGSISISIKTSLKNIKEPKFLLIINEFLPIKPIPDFLAQYFSKIGPESTKNLYSNSPISLFKS